MMVSEDFSLRITQAFQPEGESWLADLPRIIDDCRNRWSLTLGSIYPELSYHCIADVVLPDGTKAILKLGVPRPELTREIEALRFNDGRGSVLLLEGDPDTGAMVLERLVPGTQLKALEDDDEATALAASVMNRLWRPLPKKHPFRRVELWAAGLSKLRQHFDGGTGPFAKHLVEKAETFFEELLASSSEAVLIHGDLHHENILAAQREPWLAIDPKGVAGEREYEVGALVRNPMPEVASRPNLKNILAQRLDILADECGFDRKRIWGWSLAQAVLSGWWSLEDHGSGWEPVMTIAEALSEIG